MKNIADRIAAMALNAAGLGGWEQNKWGRQQGRLYGAAGADWHVPGKNKIKKFFLNKIKKKK